MDSGGLFTQEFSQESLLDIYHNHVAQTSAIGIDRLGKRQFEQQLVRHIEVLHNKANSGTYRFSQYREKLISKGAKRYPREISIPTFRDRIALRALCNVLNNIFASDLSRKIPQAIIHEVKEVIKTGEYEFFAKLDIQDFYPSICHDILLSRIKAKIQNENLLKLLTSGIETPTVPFPNKEAASNKKGVPQGLAVSNILAEIHLVPLDHSYISRDDIRYFRYVDDILVFAKTGAITLVEEMIKRLLDEHKLVAYPLKPGGTKTACGPISDTFHFLGYEFRNQRCLAKMESVKRLEDSLADIFTTYKYKLQKINSQEPNSNTRQFQFNVARNILMWRINLRVTGCLFEGARKGWVFYFSQIDEDHLEQLWRLDRTVGNLLKRFGLPSDCQAKSFVRTFFETKRRNPTANSYIPNFDTTSVEQQRIILSDYFGMVHLNGWNDEAIQAEFAKRIRRVTKELELDIQDIS
ncbi:RNA-directed DNA polymerase (Reverse transcriptase) [Acidithiobacillus ferrivorans]|uniref:RNA-directed DNA polymerase (Reverse transcriptase) n=1 Tax=Acidithiobacillus ferrivorans TaxID=160808 RepID=A0A060UTS6_9PROT|nr:RNA-directed DNA polymerase (Reverse transcriptase) [Acidithiobacillus ferrivorans]SMH65707.1 RNA-directed DNA polymerase (Reverse transcriptase) [Acidithiobacillus ferrivorans]